MDPCVSVINNTHLNDSTSSSDAADVLIGSTRVSVDPSRVEKQHKSHNKVNIYIRRISDSAHVSFDDDRCIEEDRPSLNKPPGSKTERPKVQQACGPSKQVPEPLNKDPRKEKNQAQTIMQTGNSKLKGEDVHISRYSADGRGAVSAALKKRSQSVPINRSVTVQLLDQERSQSPKVLNDPPCPSVDTGASATVAAISAAAIAATAPLLKAQSEMEAQIARVSAELKRLQGSEASAPQGRADTSAGKVTHLEEQLNVLIQQRLQHLETIQCQQIQLQNRILDSALDAVTARANADSHTHHTVSEISQTESLPAHTFTDKTFAGSLEAASKFENIEKLTGGHKSPVETPAPRKVVPKPTYWTSSSKAIKPQRTSIKTQGNGRLQDQNRNNQRSPERCDVQSVGVKRFAMATADNGQPEQSRSTQMSPKASRSGNQGPSEPAVKQQSKLEDHREQAHMASSSSAVRRAGEILRDLGRLKNEMSRLIQTADALPAQHAKSTQNSRSSHLTPSTPVPPPSTTPISMPSEPIDVIPTRAVPLNRLSILKSIQPPTSMFEDAGQVLRRVRQRKKVLEENLQAILRAKDGEVLHAQLEALSKNRDVSEELRIKKTVDAWINTLSKEIQDELARESSVSEKRIVESNNAAVTEMVQQGQGSGSSRRAGPRGGGRGGGGETSATEKKTSLRGSVKNTLPHGKQPTVCVRTKPEVNQEMPLVVKTQDDHEYLAKLYGKALYEGRRRTLKKGPYLRFTSPTPKSQTQRPKVIETVRGVVMKSSKTQTSPSVDAVSGLQPSVSEPHFLFSRSDSAQQHQPGSPVRGYLIPMAIPLGKPRVDSQAPVPSQITISDKPPIITTSLPPTTIAEPKPAPVIRKPNTILLEVQSEPKKRRPQLEIQVQPGVNIESVLCSGPASSTPLISADPIFPPPVIDAVEEPHAHEDEEENVFPGTNFLEVADISQETHVGDSPVELKGLPSPPAALYHGPAFPPQPHRSTPLTEPVLNTILQRETLENRLVDWVEQQLMARMITEMFPQPVQADPASQSELENSVTSDIVETAGGAGLQLFVDAGVPVDSELIRECVKEVLTETVALMLGQRETQRVPAEPAQTHAQEELTIVPTPVPTPEPILKEPPSPVRTPDLSEHPSTALPLEENQPQELTSPGPSRIPVDTPTTTPIPSPVRVDAPSPPPASRSPESASLPNHPGEGTELPLQEEEPHSETEEEQPPPVVMSVAREDEEESLIPTVSPLPSKPQTAPPPPFPVIQEPPLPSPAAESESSSTEESSSSSSDTVTETETAARHISEGELLFSHGQMAAVRVLNEEGILLPNLLSSLNNSMHGVQDMDYDPPSEGQVISGPRLQAHHDPILSLLARMDHGPVSQLQQPERWWVDESSGEISEGQRPLLTAAEESVLTGHSLIDQQRSAQPNTEVSPHATLTSPGQVLTDHTGAVAEESELSVTLRSSREPKEAEVYHAMAVSSPQPEDTEHQQSTETTQMVHRPAAILVRQYRDEEEPDKDAFLHAGGGGSDVRVMSVRLPSVEQDHESVSLSSVEGDTDSSANDVFQLTSDLS
ncbi:protein TALPID3 isoform X2 [Triplophysa rosa]|uniref:protein TALPID3 isoform X2 n=1 Tax=Triplophysa rosa TaxID=992332 RepID=UPI002546203D|nr:protein TALPID3 isoform X2 [Triplophysa rosa]